MRQLLPKKVSISCTINAGLALFMLYELLSQHSFYFISNCIYCLFATYSSSGRKKTIKEMRLLTLG